MDDPRSRTTTRGNIHLGDRSTADQQGAREPRMVGEHLVPLVCGKLEGEIRSPVSPPDTESCEDFPWARALASIAAVSQTGNRPMVQCEIMPGVFKNCLYDTGAAISAISEELFNEIKGKKPMVQLWQTYLPLQGVDGTELTVKGIFEMDVKLMNLNLRGHFYVIKQLSSDVLIGSDFIQEHSINYDASSNQVFQSDGMGRRNAAMISAVSIQVPAHTAKVLRVKVQSSPGKSLNGPREMVAGIGSSHLPIMGNESIISVDEEGFSRIIVSNISEATIIIPKNLFVGAVEPVNMSECKEVKLNFAESPRSVPPPKEKGERKKMEMLSEVIEEQVKHLPPQIRKQYRDLVQLNHDVFSKDKFDLGRTDVMEHKVRLRTEEPIYQKQFRIPQAHREVLLEHLKRWLDLKVVKPCTSHYSSPIFMVPKKNNELRPVLDFRRINSESFIDKYSAREVQECVDEVGRNKSKVFSSLDLIQPHDSQSFHHGR